MSSRYHHIGWFTTAVLEGRQHATRLAQNISIIDAGWCVVMVIDGAHGGNVGSAMVVVGGVMS